MNLRRPGLNQDHAAPNRQRARNCFAFFLLLGICLLATSSISAQQLVQNPGFETGDFTGWTQSGNSGDDFVSTYYAHSGLYGAELGPYGSPGFLSQTITTVPGQSYLLSLWLESDGQTPNLFLVSWNGTNTFAETNIPSIGWTDLVFTVTATSTSTVLKLGFRDDGGYLGLDDVSLTPLPLLVQNGGFETGDFTDWTLSGNTNYCEVTNKSRFVHSGTYGADLGPSNTLGYLSQAIPTIPGQAYLFSFWLENPNAGTPNEFLASWNGINLFDQVNLPQFLWSNLQFTVTATSASTVLQFGFRNDPNNFGLDDVSVTPAPQNLFVADVSGNIFEFTPNGTPSTFATGLSPYPAGLAVDSAGDVFVSDSTGNIYEYTTNGTQSTFASGLHYPGPLAVNKAGELFAVDYVSAGFIYEFTPNGSRRTIYYGLQPNALAIDKAGDLFGGAYNASENADDIYEFSPAGTLSTFATGLSYAGGLAFDSAGDLFVTDYESNSIYEFTPGGTESTFALGLFGLGSSLAFNSAGGLFAVADVNGNNGIYEFRPNGVQTIFASPSNPWQLAFQPAVPPVRTPLTVTRIAAGNDFSLFLMSDGSLWAMGYDYSGQLGDGEINLDTFGPERIVANSVTDIAAGGSSSLFVMNDGSLWEMGGNLGDGTTNGGGGFPEEIVASNVTAIAAGYEHSLFLKSDGSLWAMGNNSFGELGSGTYNDTNLPEQIVASNVVAVAAGGSATQAGADFTLFLKSDGSLWAMGDNASGQLGDGTHNNTNHPEEIVANNVSAIAAGGSHSLFLKSDGSLWAMGNNGAGQLGDGTYNSTNRPEEIVASNVRAIAAGAAHSLFLKGDGSLWAMGADQFGQLGDGTNRDTGGVNLPEEILPGTVTAISAGDAHSLFCRSDGSLWAMGSDEDDQLGDIPTYVSLQDKDTPEQIFPPGFVVQIANANPAFGEEPLTVQLSSRIGFFLFTATNNLVWNFGDGSTAPFSASTITHTYTTNGLFFPSLIVSNYDVPLIGDVLGKAGPFFDSVVGNVGGFGPAITVLAAPTNDDFSNSIAIAGSTSGYNTFATLEPNEPNPGGGEVSISNTVWWSWTAPTNGPASVQTYGSSFDTIIDLYTGSTLSTLVCVASNLNTVLDTEVNTNLIANAGLNNRLGFTATAGTTYQIQISGLSEGPIDIAVQPVAVKVLSLNQLITNQDGSINFNATVEVGNSGLATSQPLRLKVLATAGYSYDPNASGLVISAPADQVLTNYYLANPATVTPGTTTNISISAVCPGPVEVVSGGYTNVGYGWAITAVLEEQFGTNWFFTDNDFLFYGTWPTINGSPGPQAGVIRVNPSSGGSAYLFNSAAINGPTLVNQNSTTDYYGTATFSDGINSYPVNFTNTFWQASSFSITNGAFHAGSVTTNTPVTLTGYFAYNYYGYSVTNTSQLPVLVVPSAKPSLSSSEFLPNKTFGFTLNALPGSKFVVETATNLSNAQWIPLATNVTDTNGIWTFTDTSSTNQSHRFYRALEIP